MSSGSTVDPPAAPGRSRPDPAGRRGAAPPGHLLMVANLKGGTGKSTVSVNLACALAERGRRTVVVDNDPQGTAASWAGRGRLPVACVHRPLGSFAQLEPWINGVQALRARHDVVLVDLPASMAPALGASLLMATVVLVPTSPSEIDLEATQRVLVHVQRARESRMDHPPAVLVVPNRVIPLERGLTGFMERLERLGERVTPPLRQSVGFDLAFERGEWIGSLRPGSAAHQEVLALAELVEERLNVLRPPPWPMRANGSPSPVPAVTASGPRAAPPKPKDEEEPAARRRGLLGWLFGG
jgi:chromosome partitioning protein